jgi:putative DNA primase/helicase
MLDHVTDPTLCPIVTLLESGPRYRADDIISALPPKTASQAISTASHNVTGSAVTPSLAAEAVEYFEVYEKDLWDGNWAGYEDPLTGEKPFPSQSEADHYLARRIAYWGAQELRSEAELRDLVEQVFGHSGLAQRDKWQDRDDYRERTVKKACADISLAPAQVQTSFAVNVAAEPDWSLKGDLIGARFFRDRYKDRLAFVASVGKWLLWYDDKAQWRWCDLGEHIEAAKETVLELYRTACQHGARDMEKWKGIISAAASLQVESRIKAVLELAKSEAGMSIMAKELDADPELIGVRNGVVNLRTGALQVNLPDLYITKYINCDYDPSATCPIFLRFLADVFQNDADTVEAVQRLAGLTATGRPDEEVIIFCVGHGANGKSIFGNVLASIMGDYSATAPSSILAARRADDHSARSDLAMLNGARIVSINELPGGMRLDETVTKQLAGREPISARFLYKEHFTFLPRFTPWVRTNHRPIIKGTDNGIWRRMVIIPFRRTFTPEEQDNGLEAKLLNEAEGILSWMVKGAQRYLQTGLKSSKMMTSEVAQYRSDSDLLGEFLADKTVADPAAEVTQPNLYFEYKMWCEGSGLRPVSKRVLNEQLAERGIGQRKSGSTRYYTGVGQRSATHRALG